MKKKLIFGAFLIPFALVSCGGEESTDGESTDTDTTATEDTEVVEAVTYTVDTAATLFNWYNMDGDEKSHTGTFKAASGSYTLEGDQITAATLTIDMSSVTESDSNAKFLGHVTSPDFLDVANFATTEFAFDKHEEGVIYGTINVSGTPMEVAAPVTVNNGNVEVADFKIDMAPLPFFQTEREEKPEEEWHDPKIGFSGNIAGIQE